MQSDSLPRTARAFFSGDGKGRISVFFVAALALVMLQGAFVTKTQGSTPWQTTATGQEQYMLELINRARANPEVEAARYGLDLNENLPPATLSVDPRQPLVMHGALLAAARQHGSVRLNSLNIRASFVNQTAQQYATAAGYPFIGNWGCEPLYDALHPAPFPPAWQSMAATLHQTSFSNAQRRTILLDAGFQEIGVGLLDGLYNFQSAAVFTLLPAHSEGSPDPDHPFLTGVVFEDTNSNGSYDIGEGLGSVSVTIRAESSGESLAGGFTGAAGGYAVPLNAAPGTLEVSFTRSTPSAISLTETVEWPGDRNVKRDGILRPGATKILRVGGDLDFGLIEPGESRQRLLVLENLGDSPLEITRIAGPDSFQVAWNGSLEPGEARLVPVTLAPEQYRPQYGGTITVHANDTGGTNTLPCSAQGLRVDWAQSKAEAMARATATGKKVLLLAGRDRDTVTRNTRGTLCELGSPNISALLRTAYVPWYCRVDETDEAAPYLVGTENRPLPIICIIDPAEPDVALDQTGGSPYATSFYNRLLAAAPDLPRFLIHPASQQLPAEGDVYPLEVVSIGPWVVEAAPEWVTLDATGGSGNAVLSVTVAENLTENSRVGTITVNGENHEVTQQGAADPHSFFTWMGKTGLPQARAGLWENPDGDILPNIAEFLLLCDPKHADLPNVSHTLSDGMLSLTFERRKHASDTELQVWWTEDLRSWNRYTGALETLEDDGQRQLLRAGVSTNAPQAAMQLRFRNTTDSP